MKYLMNDTKEEKNGRIRRINIIDILFILLIVAIALVAVSYFTDFSFFGIGGEIRKIEYVVEFDEVDSYMAECVSVGDFAVSGSERYSMGEVKSVEISPAYRYMYNPNTGKIEKNELPSSDNPKSTLIVTMMVDAEYHVGKGFSVNGNRIAVGQDTTLTFTEFSGTGHCVSLVSLTSNN